MARRLIVHGTQPTSAGGLAHLIAPTGDRFVRKERSADDYKGYTLHEQIYALPDTYIGSIERYVRQEFILDWVAAKLSIANVELAEGIIRCYLEILSNAGDNADASRRFGVPAGSISVTMDRNRVTVRSEGEPIPVVPKQDMSSAERCLTFIDFVFGQLLTSSHYDTRVIRMGCGKNGFGAKLVNIFSLLMQVKVGDPRRPVDPNDLSKGYRGGHEHISVWEGNMTRHVTSQSSPAFVYGPLSDGTTGWGAPADAKFYTGPAYVEVSWVLDFKRFECHQAGPDSPLGYPDEAFGLFARYLADFSLTCKVPVSFNGVDMDVRNIRDYGTMYFTEEQCATAITHYEWDGGEPPEAIGKLRAAAREKFLAQCPTADCVPIVEMCILDTPDNARVLSFVNGLMTIDGGVHVDEPYAAVSKEVLTEINKTVTGGRAKRGKVKKGEEKKPDAKLPHLTPSDVKPHVSIIINCRLPDPIYTSQSKTKLSRPKPKITIPDTLFTAMGRWSLTERLLATLDAKMFKTLAKSDGKKRRHVLMDKGEDANDAGGPLSNECILYIVEGKSASAYPKKRIVMTPGGKNKCGYYPLKGKPLNVTDAPYMQISENEEINAVKKMMGFREGVDYKDPEMRKTLRYGFLMGNMDADSDGKHIIALWLNILFRRWPSILELGLFGFLMTPVVRLFDGTKCVMRFYSPAEYNAWAAKNPGHGYKVKYYKGLGTSRDVDIKDDLSTAPMVICVYDDRTTGPALDLAFRKTQADQRKEWIQKWRTATKVEDVVAVPMSLFLHRGIESIINHDLVDYTVDSLFRAIPSFKDGLKKSQRQGLYYMLTNWNYGHSRGDSEKVAEIACATSKLVKYHHGPKSMADTLIGMAQDFVGANNLIFLRQDGQFGTRDEGGADGADGRYSETRPEWWIQYAYFKELVELITCRTVEGKEVEPGWLPCIVPMHVINGTAGVATGHSTFLPAHNPYAVIRWLVDRCRGIEKPEPLVPWYHGFNGTIEIMRAPPSTTADNVDILTAAFSAEATLGDPVKVPKPSRLTIARVEKSPRLSIMRTPEIKLPLPEEITEPVDASTYLPPLPPPTPKNESTDETLSGTAALTRMGGRRIKGVSMKTQGVFTVTGVRGDGKHNILVTELPIGRWLHDYRKWLEQLLKDKKIEDFKDNSTTEVPHYTIIGFSHAKGVNHETLRLSRSYGLSNQNLLDDDGYPVHCKDTQAVMEMYYQNMIDLYTKVIANRIAKMEEEIVDYNYRFQFITAVLEEKITVFRRPKGEIHLRMDELKIPRKYLGVVKLLDFSAEEMEECRSIVLAETVQLIELRKLAPQAVWSEKLYAFDAALRHHKYE